jgi:putative transposase
MPSDPVPLKYSIAWLICAVTCGVLIEYQAHYNTARPHQGIAQRIPGRDREVPGITAVNLDVQRIRRKSVLNGLINEYSRAA